MKRLLRPVILSLVIAASIAGPGVAQEPAASSFTPVSQVIAVHDGSAIAAHMDWTTRLLTVEPVAMPGALEGENASGCALGGTDQGWAVRPIGVGDEFSGCPRSTNAGPLARQTLVCMSVSVQESQCGIMAQGALFGGLLPQLAEIRCAFGGLAFAHVGWDETAAASVPVECTAGGSHLVDPAHWNDYEALVWRTDGYALGMNNAGAPTAP